MNTETQETTETAGLRQELPADANPQVADEPRYPHASATYSPEDDKLRLYFSSRLPSYDYAEVKAAGFRWAPKQECFYAVWSPAAEDCAREFCGEIGDEDKSLVERAEERAERFEGYSESRSKEAAAARAAVSRIADGIPMGQPILVGHHSERHARRDAERIENGMRRAVEAFETAGYWQSRAAGAIRAAKYKERPDVRARRIKKLEAEHRDYEREMDKAQYGLKFWSGKIQYRKRDTEEIFTGEMNEENRGLITCILGIDPRLSRFYVKKEDTASGPRWWSAWDVLRADRYAEAPVMTVAEVVDIALKSYKGDIVTCTRVLAHIDGRLDYERAMLAADGGTVADRTRPEVGGVCRCWASNGAEWTKIKKVNKVSVTLLDNWGNGGKDFTRTIPFDKLLRVMSKADVDAARDEGRVSNETERGMHIRPRDTEPTPASAPKASPESDPAAAETAAMRESLKAGVQVVSASNLFPTPPKLADDMVALACIQSEGMTVLEPSAGTGRILDALPWLTNVLAVEINGQLCDMLRAKYRGLTVIGGDFLACSAPGLNLVDRVVMNPPFENGSDIAHILHALKFLAPEGRLVALCADGPRQQKALKPMAEASGGCYTSLGCDWFEGTKVNVAMVVILRQD